MNLMPYDYIPPVDIKTEPYIPETGETDRRETDGWDRKSSEQSLSGKLQLSFCSVGKRNRK